MGQTKKSGTLNASIYSLCLNLFARLSSAENFSLITTKWLFEFLPMVSVSKSETHKILIGPNNEKQHNKHLNLGQHIGFFVLFILKRMVKVHILKEIKRNIWNTNKLFEKEKGLKKMRSCRNCWNQILAQFDIYLLNPSCETLLSPSGD